MKRSDTEMDTQTGKFVAGTNALTTVTPAMVVQRAKEIAVTNGRRGNDYTQNDYDQAKNELVGFPNTEATELEDGAPAAGTWLGEAGDTGHKTPVRGAKDEQVFGEDLAQQGVDEATHNTMMAGNQTSRERDQS